MGTTPLALIALDQARMRETAQHLVTEIDIAGGHVERRDR